MWVSVVLGFDPDGQKVHKWREAFQRHGTLEGWFTHGEEYVKVLGRHTQVARVRADGQDVLPPLADAVVRVAEGRRMNATGIAEVSELSSVWRVQSWRMEIISLDRPKDSAIVHVLDTQAPTATV